MFTDSSSRRVRSVGIKLMGQSCAVSVSQSRQGRGPIVRRVGESARHKARSL
jgi:hypothetical protein